MSRKQFIESEGATCSNWTWSWSFVNDEERMIIFGASNVHETGDEQLILSKNWEFDLKKRRKNGYIQGVAHLRLVKENGYTLRTFRQTEAPWNPETGSVTITSFDRELEDRLLLEKRDGWYAITKDNPQDTSATTAPHKGFYMEGLKTVVTSQAIERSAKARSECLKEYGYKCCVCDFEECYGRAGREFIHVHHLHPIAEADGPRLVDPIEDLRPVCPNCHAIIHRGRKVRSIEEMRVLLIQRNNGKLIQ